MPPLSGCPWQGRMVYLGTTSQQSVTSHFQVSIIMTRHQLEMLDDYATPILFFNPCIDLLHSLTSFFLNLLIVPLVQPVVGSSKH